MSTEGTWDVQVGMRGSGRYGVEMRGAGPASLIGALDAG
eukprot:CAMPEP_0175755846 /NCGR_PEP_ID=MMETSP0097-20121207/63616_1 /TAXON_ID=311494 /ORGANISM="Alexandrium monilatum, Strain CCMP3105" /LENGTH=38 /DNA_ID= /DNA_START= /DNA_END= /DNA_ORIENTATION=